MPDDGLPNAYQTQASVAAVSASQAQKRMIRAICRNAGGPLNATTAAGTGRTKNKKKAF